MGENGGIIGPVNIPAATAESSVASGVWTLDEAQKNKAQGKWPDPQSFIYDLHFLVIAGGGSGNGMQGVGGGAGGYRSAWNSETSGGGASSETAIQVDTLSAGDGDINAGVSLTCTIGAGRSGRGLRGNKRYKFFWKRYLNYWDRANDYLYGGRRGGRCFLF